MYKRILAAVDGSENGDRAAARAGAIAKAQDGELVLLNVEPRAPVPDDLKHFARVEHLDQGPSEIWESIARAVLHRARDRAEKAGGSGIRVQEETMIGDPAEEILKVLDGGDHDLVVVGSRGFGRVKGLLLGSVSQKLAANARADVLIVR